jgi:hypothetical protein
VEVHVLIGEDCYPINWFCLYLNFQRHMSLSVCVKWEDESWLFILLILKGSTRLSWSHHFESFTVATMPKEKGNKDKQRSTKHTHTTKDRVTWTPLKTGGEFRCSGRLTSSCSTSGTRRVNLVTNPGIALWYSLTFSYRRLTFFPNCIWTPTFSAKHVIFFTHHEQYYIDIHV